MIEKIEGNVAQVFNGFGRPLSLLMYNLTITLECAMETYNL